MRYRVRGTWGECVVPAHRTLDLPGSRGNGIILAERPHGDSSTSSRTPY